MKKQKKDIFLKEEQVEKEKRVNLSVGTQKQIKVRLKGGKYDGIVTEIPELKARNMIGYGKAEIAGPNAPVIEPENHENEARKIKKAKEEKEAEARQTK